MTSISVTGEFGMSRDELENRLNNLDIYIQPALGKNVSALLIGDGGKEMKISEAKLSQIPTLNGHAFLNKVLSSKKNVSKEALIQIISSIFLAEQRKKSSESSLRKRKREQNYSEKYYIDQSYYSLKQAKKPKRSQKKETNTSRAKKQTSSPSGKVIALEGLIGIGKSTLCNKLKSTFPNQCEIYREETNEKFLKLFYSNPKKYGFSLQWGMLKTRIYQLRLAQHDTKYIRIPKRNFFFWDRSMVGDYTFALLNHVLGGLSVEEMNAYENEFGGSILDIAKVPFMSDIHLFVLLNSEPSECKYRLENLRMNESEQSIPLSYYEGLDDIHFFVFLKLIMTKVSKVLIQSWGEYDDPMKTKDVYEKVLKQKTKLPVVEFKSIPNMASEKELIYSDESDIMKTYERMNAKDTEHLEKIESIYIPKNIMRVEPEEKNMDREIIERYGIKLYRNEYKRVILWHLSKFQNVYLYE